MQKLPLQELMAQAGSLECTSPWLEVTQAMIDQFADATNDHQFIHINAERAKAETPFGGTIAHGFLTLSLLTQFASKCVPRAEETKMAINYGFEKIRFLVPVSSGANLRAHFKLLEMNERIQGEYLSRYGVSVEMENVEKPALVAEWLSLTITKDEGI